MDSVKNLFVDPIVFEPHADLAFDEMLSSSLLETHLGPMKKAIDLVHAMVDDNVHNVSDAAQSVANNVFKRAMFPFSFAGCFSLVTTVFGQSCAW
jgi:hypothetical protein